MPEHFSQKPFLHIALHTFDLRATDAISFMISLSWKVWKDNVAGN